MAGDDYAKGWEEGVRFAIHVMNKQGTVEDAMIALSMELIKAERLRQAAGRNARVRIDP
jgi:hypothetical protein